ncbi:MAG: hypothetical protein AB2693_14105 [Candidatus Thiodiazotropha sp.]
MNNIELQAALTINLTCEGHTALSQSHQGHSVHTTNTLLIQAVAVDWINELIGLFFFSI